LLNNKIIKKIGPNGFGLFAKQKIVKDEIIWKQTKNSEIIINLKQYSK
jgi:hypothetical protein